MLALKTEKKELAFGRAPAFCRYELYMERYRSAADFIHDHTRAQRQRGESVQLLDVGAGCGDMSFFLESGFELHGTDIWPERIRKCRQLGYAMEHHDIDEQPLPYEAEKFDVAVASHVLEHLYDAERGLQRIMRVLKPGGLLIIGLPMHPRWLAALCRVKSRFFPEPKGGHQSFFCRPSLDRFIADLDVRDIRGFRVLSARRRANWENNESFYRWNVEWGKRFPYLSPEVNVVAVK